MKKQHKKKLLQSAMALLIAGLYLPAMGQGTGWGQVKTYPGSTTAIVAVSSAAAGDTVGIFGPKAGGGLELRSKNLLVTYNNMMVANTLINGDVVEQLTAKLWRKANAQIVDLTPQFASKPGSALGSITTPIMLAPMAVTVDPCAITTNLNTFKFLGKLATSNYIAYKTGMLTYAQAVDLAASQGGTLLVINNKAENDFIAALMAANFGTNSIITALNDVVTEGVYRWPDGTTYTNWAPGEPNNGLGINEDYVCMFTNGTMNDVAGTTAFNVIIELPVCPVPLTGLKATASIDKLKLEWTSAADSYKITRMPDNSVFTPTASPFEDTGLLPDTEYSYNVSAIKGINENSYQIKARTLGINTLAPWDSVGGSDTTHLVVLAVNTIIDLNGDGSTDLEDGDLIGLGYYNSDGEFITTSTCVYYTNKSLVFYGIGDNLKETPTEKDGFTINEVMNFRVMKAADSREYAMIVDYEAIAGDFNAQGNFKADGYSKIRSMRTCFPQVIDFVAHKWKHFSLITKQMTTSPKFADHFPDVISNRQTLFIKDEKGLPVFTCLAGVVSDNLAVDYSQGYKGNSPIDLAVEFCLDKASPQIPQALTTGTPNYVPILGANAEIDFAAATDAIKLDIIYAKYVFFDVASAQYRLKTYIPTYSYNTIGNIAHGEALAVAMRNTKTFSFPTWVKKTSSTTTITETLEPKHFSKLIQKNSESMLLMLRDTIFGFELQKGDEIAAFDEQNNLIGVAVYNNEGHLVLPVFEGESMEAGGPVELGFKLFASGKLSDLAINEKIVWKKDALKTVEARIVKIGAATGDLEEIAVFPNPATDKLNIQLPKGRYEITVASIDGKIMEKREVNTEGKGLQFDLAGYTKGVYLIKVGGEKNMTAKFVKE